MKRRVMRQEDVAEFCRYLQGEERSQGTIETYRREIRAFAATLPENRVVTKEVVVAWKETLAKRYAVSTVNGKLAALNGLFSFLGWRECRVKPLRRQRELFRDKGRELDKGEYLRLLAAAKRRENWRLYYLMETLASTGMRVSELRFVTVQALAAGRVRVDCKGKHHDLFDSQAVQGFRELLPAAEENVGAGLCHPDRAACGPFQHLAGDAGPQHPGGGGGEKGVSPQLPAFVCPGVLQPGEGYGKAGGPFGTRQRRDDSNLYYGERCGA